MEGAWSERHTKPKLIWGFVDPGMFDLILNYRILSKVVVFYELCFARIILAVRTVRKQEKS